MMPPPSAQAIQHQRKLLDYLQHKTQQQGGVLSFADFMQLALYAPGLGYYSAGLDKLGASGDFITAPEISSLFSQCLGMQCIQILSQLSSDALILELGAGSGKMAGDLLSFLASRQCLPKQYQILEISADLKARQQAYLQTHCAEFYDRIVWCQSLPTTPFEGIIVANEVIDAMPVHLFKVGDNQEILEGCVHQKEDAWHLDYRSPLTASLPIRVQHLMQRLSEPLAPGYTSEILLSLEAWIASLSACLTKGVMLFLDYGFPSHEYYHPSRSMGTLMCHYRHQAHSDPMRLIGLQDITAHVDFTAVAFAAHAAHLEVAGFTHQAGFLLGNGLPALAEKMPSSAFSQYTLSQQIQRLTAPHEMGELFKAIALTKDFDEPLAGFAFSDQRHRL